jgi:hypothetical protein
VLETLVAILFKMVQQQFHIQHSSDYRLKENILPMTGALVTVQALKPVTYTWKVDGSDWSRLYCS